MLNAVKTHFSDVIILSVLLSIFVLTEGGYTLCPSEILSPMDATNILRLQNTGNGYFDMLSYHKPKNMTAKKTISDFRQVAIFLGFFFFLHVIK